VSRSPNGMYSLFQCGRFGHGDSPHSHADMLHLDISVGTDNFIIDPGTCVYTADRDKRNRYRSAAVHNGPTITGLRLENPRDPFGWLQVPDCRVMSYHRTEKSEFYRAGYEATMDRQIAMVSRSVLFIHDMLWIVCDSVVTATPCQSQWNFITPCSAVIRKDNVCLMQGGAGGLAFIPSIAPDEIGTITVEPFDYSDDYLSTRTGQRVTITGQASGSGGALFILQPFQKEAELPEQISVLQHQGNMVVKSVLGGTTMLVSRGGVMHSELDTDADFAFLRISDQTVDRAVIVNGSRIAYQSRELVRLSRAAGYVDIIKDKGEYRINVADAEELTMLVPKGRS